MDSILELTCPLCGVTGDHADMPDYPWAPATTCLNCNFTRHKN